MAQKSDQILIVQIGVLAIDSIINLICQLLNEKPWAYNLYLFLTLMMIGITIILITRTMKLTFIQYATLRFMVLVVYTELNLIQPVILILIGHFQQLVIDDSMVSLFSLLYLAIRIGINGDTAFVVLKFLILCLPYAHQLIQAKDCLLPKEIFGLILTNKFAVFKNNGPASLFSNIDEELGLVCESDLERTAPFQTSVDSFCQRQSTLNKTSINHVLAREFFNISENKHLIIRRIHHKGDQYQVVSLVTNNNQKDNHMRRNLHKIAHDMRTPLNAIINLQECLFEYIDPFYSQRYLKPSMNSCKLLMHLLDDILDAAQLEINKLKINMQSFNMEKFLKKTLQIFEIQAGSRQIQIHVMNNLTQKTITTDKNRLRQILMNLISNAIKYTMPKGNIYIKVQEAQKGYVQITVEDTGLGIKSEDLKKLFKDFQKVSNIEDSQLNQRGIGLGLQISKELAILLGSENGIQVNSAYGVGTTFVFYIKNQTEEDKLEESEELGIGNYVEAVITQGKKPFPEPQSTISEHHLPTLKSLFLKKISNSSINSGVKIPNFQLLQLSITTPMNIDTLKSIQQQPQSQQVNSIKYEFENSQKLFYSANFQEQKLDDKQSLKLSQQMIAKKFTKLHQGTFSVISQLLDGWKEKFNGKPEVLVVDDNEFNSMALKFMLESFGIFADTAISGQEAVERVTERDKEGLSYRCIFMDIEMPGMDGLRATQEIRKNNSTSIIFACSGWSDQAIKNSCLAAGMQDLLTKPVQRQKIKAILSKYFNDLQVRDQSITE